MSSLFLSMLMSSSTLSSSYQSSQVQSSVASNIIDSMILPISIPNAEIKYSMKVVQSHFSFQSCIDLSKLFYDMFPDSEIAQKFQQGKSKCAYLVNYGMAPFVKDQLVKNIVASPFCTISFDESMNRVLQNEQMDVQVRYWDVNTSIASTCYFDSQFLLRLYAQSLLDCLVQSINSLPVENFIQLCMDGPTTNWAVLNNLVEN